MEKAHDIVDQVKPTRKYQKIDKEQRKLVLKMLMQDRLSLQEVANRLSLKYCTVRTIQKAYEKDGRIGKKETRKKKLKLENILKISVINPLTLQLSLPIVSSEVSQIYIDKQLSSNDSALLQGEQRSLLQQQAQKFYISLQSQLQKSIEAHNMYCSNTLQSLLLASQLVFKQLLEVKPQINVKQEYEPLSPNLTQYPQTHQQQYYQQLTQAYSRLRA